MEEIKKLSSEFLKEAPFDSLAYAFVDFKSGEFKSFDLSPFDETLFDLASLTKPLVLSLSYFLDKKIFNEDLLRLLEHRAGLPAWARLSRSNWREFVEAYQIKDSATLYSDLSALRLLCELEKKVGPLKEYVEKFYKGEIFHWRDHPDRSRSPFTGVRFQKKIQGIVHDDNAYNLKSFLSHAGLFSSLRGLFQTLVLWNEKTDFIKKMDFYQKSRKGKTRFALGFDTAGENSLAGVGCSERTFGHLGFTGTSFWIDPKQMKGQILLTNACYPYWFHRQKLNQFRRIIGNKGWQK